MSACSPGPYGATLTNGVSDLADFVVKLSAKYDREWRTNVDFHSKMSSALDALHDACGEASSSGWDGYGASAVEASTCDAAKKVLRILPLGTEMPTVAPDADGFIAFEWYRSPRRSISVSVGPDGKLYYAALIGTGSRHGTVPFYGSLPGDLLDLIREVTA